MKWLMFILGGYTLSAIVYILERWDIPPCGEEDAS